MSPDKNLNEPKKLDTSSIKTTTLFSFLMYAMILVAFLWVLTSFFLDTYYQKMRTQEVIRTADAVEAQYLKGSSGFSKYAAETTSYRFFRLTGASCICFHDRFGTEYSIPVYNSAALP